MPVVSSRVGSVIDGGEYEKIRLSKGKENMRASYQKTNSLKKCINRNPYAKQLSSTQKA